MNLTETELRELDAWIAEHVMGWKRKTWREVFGSEYDEPNAGEFDDNYYDSTGAFAAYVRGECDCGQHDIGFCPTTESAAALEVLKRCAARGVLNGEFKLPVSIFRRGDGQWVVSENCEDAPEHEFCIVVEAATLELAIGRFAKKLFSKNPVIQPSTNP